MKAMILAGGMHRNMHPLFLRTPVGMAELFGKPVLEHTLALLRAGGIREAGVILGEGAGQIMDHFGDGKAFGVALSYFVQEGRQGMAGAVRACLSRMSDEEVLVLRGDLVWETDLEQAVRFHRERGGQATLMLARGMGSLGDCLAVTDEAGKVLRLVSEPGQDQEVTDQVSSGVCILSPAALALMPEQGGFDLERDLLVRLLAQGGTVYGCPVTGYWKRLDSCGDYLACAADALGGKVKLEMGLPQQAPGIWSQRPVPDGVTVIPPCWLGPGAALEQGSVVGPYVMLGRETRVERGSIVQRSILLSKPGRRNTPPCTVRCWTAARRQSGERYSMRGWCWESGPWRSRGLSCWPGYGSGRDG